MNTPQPRRGEPIFNLPPVLMIIIGLLAVIHASRETLPAQIDDQIIGLFAFGPTRYFEFPYHDVPLMGGLGADIWTFFTYAFLHADITHLVSNCVMFAAVGNALVERLGTWRFIGFCVMTGALAAAGQILVAEWQTGPVIGISGVICALLGGLSRFLFPGEAGDGPEPVTGQTVVVPDDLPAILRPTAPVLETLKRPKVIQFVLAFAIMNLILALGAPLLLGEGNSLAWMVHVAGFIAGFLLFPAFDPLDHMTIDRFLADRVARADGE